MPFGLSVGWEKLNWVVGLHRGVSVLQFVAVPQLLEKIVRTCVEPVSDRNEWQTTQIQCTLAQAQLMQRVLLVCYTSRT